MSFAPRETFDRNLHHLLDEVLLLGSVVEQAVLQSVSALRQRDCSLARRLIQGDRQVNERRYALENTTIGMIATQQPMARDIRLLAAVLEVITELERIGDYAKGIARINLLLGDEDIELDIICNLQLMADRGLDMLHRALGAFISRDAQTARAIPLEDDAVDQLYYHIYNELMKKKVSDVISLQHLNHLMWVAHNLERMADRVTNICERIVFACTGEILELDHATKKEYEEGS